MLNKIENIENKQDSFWKINFKKLVLFLALLAFVPVPVSFALSGGISTILFSIPGMLFMIATFLELSFAFSLLFFGQIFAYLFGGYTLACIVYKLLSLIKRDIKKVPWWYISIIVALLLGVYLWAHFTGVFYIIT